MARKVCQFWVLSGARGLLYRRIPRLFGATPVRKVRFGPATQMTHPQFQKGNQGNEKRGILLFFLFFFFYAIAFQLKLVSLSVFFLLLQILQGGYFGGWATAGDRCIWSCSIVGSRSAGALERLMTAPAVGRFFFRKGFGVERCHRQMEGRKRVFFYLWNLLLLLGNASLSTMNSSHGGFFV